MTFSSLYRNDLMNHMNKEEYDLLIIGGGITGAGIALDAVTRGLTVALVEMQDFAAGTSSRSTKLVHGGLRYLKQFEVKMVAEIGKERAIVFENGPHVTTPEWMLLPIHKGGTFGMLSTSIGLRVYDKLAGVKKAERRSMLSVEETIKKEPLIKRDNLRGGGYYVEYKTDDARLTVEVMKKAASLGADIVNYVKSERFLYENKKVIGIEATDLMSGNSFQIRAKKIVNAAGPWVDDVRKKDYSQNNKKLRLSKGVHIVLDHSVFPLNQAIYFDTPDGRMIFAIPRAGKAYVGTTDTFYQDEKSHPKMLAKDREYLLEAIHYMFPNVKVTEKDVESSWTGVRPLIYEQGKDPSEISRKDEVWEAQSGLITIAGGKLTGYRHMAEIVVDLVTKDIKKRYKRKFRSCKTEHLPISGGDVGGSKGFERFANEKAKEAVKFGLSQREGIRFAHTYGSNVDELYKIAHTYQLMDWEKTLSPYIYAQLMYGIHEEMVVKPVDFFIRRTGYLFFSIDEVRKWKEPVIAIMAEVFQWSPYQLTAFKEELEVELKDAIVPVDLQ
jgi:glycerol-3-phosphate dehydrogenase